MCFLEKDYKVIMRWTGILENQEKVVFQYPNGVLEIILVLVRCFIIRRSLLMLYPITTMMFKMTTS